MANTMRLASHFAEKLFTQTEFANFLNATAKSCIECVKESNTDQWGIRDTYLAHQKAIEASYNEQHTQKLEEITRNFEDKCSELLDLKPTSYTKLKLRTLYEAEQELLHAEQMSRQYISFLPLKQINGQFTEHRWLSLISPNQEITANDKAMIVEERGDEKIVEELFYPTKKVKTLFSAFSDQAIEHMQQTAEAILTWEKGKVAACKDQYDLLSQDKKCVLLSYSLISYASTLKAMQKEGISPYNPTIQSPGSSFECIKTLFETTDKQVFHLKELVQISIPSPRSKPSDTIDKRSGVFFKHLGYCKNTLTDFITLLNWNQTTENTGITQKMEQLHITEPNEAVIAMDVINPMEKYLEIFRLAEKILTTISQLGDI